MFEIKLTGFKTKEQAEAFIEWYSEQGEQDSAVWFSEMEATGHLDVDKMEIDCSETFPLKWNSNVVLMVLDIEP